MLNDELVVPETLDLGVGCLKAYIGYLFQIITSTEDTESEEHVGVPSTEFDFSAQRNIFKSVFFPISLLIELIENPLCSKC